MLSALRKLGAAIGRHSILLFGVLVALSCIASGVSYLHMIEAQHRLSSRLLDSQFWMSAQFGREMQDLTSKLALFDGSPAAAEFIRTKLDIAIGRTDLLLRSSVEPVLEPETRAKLAEVAARLEALQPRVAGLEAGGPKLGRELAAEADVVAAAAVRVMVRAHQQDGDNRTALALAVEEANQTFLVSLLFLLASFFLILRASMLQARRLDHAGAALRQALTHAEAGVRAKAAFLATMSHEIRTPMNGVLGAASLLARTTLDHTQRRAVEIVTGCGEALMAQLDDVLDFSALEADRVELSPELCEVRSFAARTCAMVEPAAGQRGVDLALVIDPDVPATLVFDYRRLRQVMLNLLSNAIKFTSSGGVVVRMSLRWSGSSAWLRVAVIDTGAGMTPEGRRRIFEEFTRLENEAAASVRGTGLGLAICNRLIAKMQGHIAAVSAPGQGSIFLFRVPVVVGAAPAWPLPPATPGTAVVIGGAACIRRALAQNLAVLGYSVAASNTPAAMAPALVLAQSDVPDADIPLAGRVLRFGAGAKSGLSLRLHGVLSADALNTALADTAPSAPAPAAPVSQRAMRILVADDDAVNREIAASLLSFAGHAVVTVDGGVAAVAALRGGGFDFALIDRHMPDGDGEMVARTVRAMPRPVGRMPLISITADAGHAARATLTAAGFDDVLVKPVTLDQLTVAMDAVLQQGPAGSTPAGQMATPAIDAAFRQDLAAKMPPASLAQIIRTFWDQVPPLLAALDPASGRNPDGPLHALSGSAASLGYAGAAEAARHCRKQIGQDGFDGAMQALAMALAEALDRETADLPEPARQRYRLALRQRSLSQPVPRA